MKILLINPPYTRFKGLIDRYFPIGLGYLAAVLEKAGHTALIYNVENSAIGEGEVNWEFIHRLDVFDEFLRRQADENNFIYEEIRNVLKEFKPDLIGISNKTVTFKITLRVAKICKSIFPEVPIVMGGVHSTACPDEIISNEFVDFNVIGEGEETLTELAAVLEKRQSDFSKIKGLYYKDKYKNVFKNELRPLIQELDKLPLPAWHLLLNNHNYSKTLYQSMLGGIFTSRGCPFRCAFCYWEMFGGKVRWRSPELVIEEIQLMKEKYGVIEFYFWDDVFTVNKQRLIQFCNLLIEKKVNIAWRCHSRADLWDADIIKLVKKAGCYRTSLGIESGCEETLKYMNKKLNLDTVRKCAELLNKYNLPWNAAFIIGFPEETEEQMLETFEFIKQINPGELFLSVFTPFPGTELYYKTKELGLLEGEIEWEKFETKGPKNAFVLKVSKERFQELHRTMMKWIDEYNKTANTFWYRLKMRLPYYKKHPVLFARRTYEYLYKMFYNVLRPKLVHTSK